MDWKGPVIGAMELARAMTISAGDGLDEKEMMFQPREGLNHALWLLGHVATSENGLVLHACAGKNLLPEWWMGKFGIKSQPVAEAGFYPTKGEVLEMLGKTHAAAMEYVGGLTEKALGETPINLARFPATVQAKFGTVAKCLGGHITHEGGHAGQIAMLRRLMGKPPRV